jgi:hypothetical protein
MGRMVRLWGTRLALLLKLLVMWKGLDFREIFTPVAHLGVIRILLAFAASKGFKLYQMDVESAFLNGVI